MESLIINKRHELPKYKRVLWDLVTVLLWISFIYLWMPVLWILFQILMSDAPMNEIANSIFDEVDNVTFHNAVIMLISTPTALFILSRINRHHAPSEHLIFHRDDYADYFEIDKEFLHECSDGQFITVYFDDHGKIISLDNKISSTVNP